MAASDLGGQRRPGGCPDGRCDGSGFLFEEERRVAHPCSCRPQRLARRKAAAVAGRIPRRFREISFGREPMLSIERGNPHVVREVRRYVESIGERLDQGRGIWFRGDVGTGKTTLAMLISRAAMHADRTVAIYSLPRLLGMLRETYDDDSELSLNGLIDRLCSVDLLHVDDVGAEQSSPWVLEQLYTIVNTRYEDGRAIVLTTNLEDRDLRTQIGDRTVSRLYELCGDPLPVYGPDRRMDAYLRMPDASPSAGTEPAPAASAVGRGRGWDPDADLPSWAPATADASATDASRFSSDGDSERDGDEDGDFTYGSPPPRRRRPAA